MGFLGVTAEGKRERGGLKEESKREKEEALALLFLVSQYGSNEVKII